MLIIPNIKTYILLKNFQDYVFLMIFWTDEALNST